MGNYGSEFPRTAKVSESSLGNVRKRRSIVGTTMQGVGNEFSCATVGTVAAHYPEWPPRNAAIQTMGALERREGFEGASP